MDCKKPVADVPFTFPVEEFLSEFPAFSEANGFTTTQIVRVGRQAHRYITEWRDGFPLPDPEDRCYALFLMTGHILTLRKNIDDSTAAGQTPQTGRISKAIVGAVTVETDSPNTYNSDDYNYWLAQTPYGQELLAYLQNSAPAGIFCNTRHDSVRVFH